MAKEVKRQPSAATRPPTTAVSRVDLRLLMTMKKMLKMLKFLTFPNLQKATVTGERMRETEGDRAANQACNIRCSYLMLCCFVVFMMFR